MLRQLKSVSSVCGQVGRQGALIVLAAGLLFWAPRLLGPVDYLTALEKFGFDLVQRFAASHPAGELQIIEMDQQSFRRLEQDTAGLWNRSLHAQLLLKLTKDGARVVVFDILFDKANLPESDRQLAEAMRNHGRVAIAALRDAASGTGVAGFQTIMPIADFKAAVAGVGMVNVPKDRDGAVRRPFTESEDQPSLARVAARLAGAAALPEPDRVVKWIRFNGPPQSTLPRISYSDALEQSDGYFRDKFVFVGSALRVKRPGEDVDFFRTPYTRWDGKEAPGVALLATAFLNLIRGESITRMSWPMELLLLVLMALGAKLVLGSTNPLRATLVALALAVGIAAGGFALQEWGGVMFPWIVPSGIMMPCAWVWALLAGWQERCTADIPQEVASASPSPEGAEKPTHVGTTTVTVPVAKIPDHTLLHSVGRGAYGEVWLARNAIGLFHAVKVIYRRDFDNDDPYEREFRGVTKFMPISRSHPGFVNILHVGRDDTVGCFFCIMEAADDETHGSTIHPDGYKPKTLGRHLHKQHRLASQECLQLGMQLSSALSHLHESGLIHRDIKPGNIIFVNGVLKLADIGLVTDVPRDAGPVTYLGTMGYIAPEGPGTPLADIYSLGKVLYECFTGKDREEFPDLPSSLLNDPEASHFSLNQIILKACERNPSHRYQTAAQLHADLLALKQTPGSNR